MLLITQRDKKDKMNISITFDVEPDLHSGRFDSLKYGIPRILDVLDKYRVKGTFFTTCDCIENNPEIFRRLIKEGHEIAAHGYRHARFDELTFNEAEESLLKSIETFQKYLKIRPKGFRAPQLSIDAKTLDLLEKNNYGYDSSFGPKDFMLLLFLPKKFKFWLNHFFSSSNKYRIRKNLAEIPTSALLIPFVSLFFRIFHPVVLKTYFNSLKLFHKEIVIYFHSWDFIDVPESRIDRLWNKEKLIYNLDQFLYYAKKKNKFVKVEELLNNY